MDHTDFQHSRLFTAPIPTLNLSLPMGTMLTASTTPTSLGDVIHQQEHPPKLMKTSEWVADSEADYCTNFACSAPFTFYVRKHHCRVCGGIYCHQCSSDVLQAGVGAVRTCDGCYFLHHLAVFRNKDHRERRRYRGSLKMLQAAVLVSIMQCLPLTDIINLSLVSSDFYFIAKENKLWSFLIRRRWTSTVVRDTFQYTHYRTYVKKHITELCQGATSVLQRMRNLLSNPVRVCVLGPPGVGKTALVHRMVQRYHTTATPGSGSPRPLRQLHHRPTVGGVAYEALVHLTGVGSNAKFVVNDTAGDDRYAPITELFARNSHVLIFCFSLTDKASVEGLKEMLTRYASVVPTRVPFAICGIVDMTRATEEEIENSTCEEEAAAFVAEHNNSAPQRKGSLRQFRKSADGLHAAAEAAPGAPSRRVAFYKRITLAADNDGSVERLFEAVLQLLVDNVADESIGVSDMETTVLDVIFKKR